MQPFGIDRADADDANDHDRIAEHRDRRDGNRHQLDHHPRPAAPGRRGRRRQSAGRRQQRRLNRSRRRLRFGRRSRHLHRGRAKSDRLRRRHDDQPPAPASRPATDRDVNHAFFVVIVDQNAVVIDQHHRNDSVDEHHRHPPLDQHPRHDQYDRDQRHELTDDDLHLSATDEHHDVGLHVVGRWATGPSLRCASSG